MFYSETLLQKTGPLARVWLSANLERKLSKTHILQSNVKDSVDAIITPNQAPMALRLSGQLLLGVVRIYSRKARYLLDDCNEALMKIKMAFRLSGNNDIPAGLHMPSRDALMLPDVLTEGDNLEMPPMPDASFLLLQMEDDNTSRKRRAGSRDINLHEDFNTSQFLQGSIETRNYEEELALEPMDDIDLDLDFGTGNLLPSKGDESMEVGRDAPAARAIEEDVLSEMDIQVPSKEVDLGGDNEPSITFNFGNDDDELRLQDDDGDVDMFNIGEQTDISALPPAPILGRERISESPLSDVDETIIAEHQRALDASVYEQVEESEQSIYRRPAQRAKKVLKVDDITMLTKQVIKEQQKNHDVILQPLSFLPRDPELLALMELQKNGGFVSSIMGGGRSAGWAPELRGMLSLEAVRRTGDLKRKRDSGAADVDNDQEGARKSPRLELGEQEEELPVIGDAGLGQEETIIPVDNTVMEVPGEEEFMQMQEDDGRISAAPSPGAAFDETTAPLIHPADNGPISLGTKHAVHLLRDQFGAEAANSPAKRRQASVLFQDLLPEATTTRADATKMFFEVLVLATKDAVKIEQQEGLLGGPIRVRGKRGLWGDWAEREAGGEIAEEANVPLEASTSVAVAA